MCRCLLYYYGDESEIDLEANGEREFSEWTWLPLEQLPEEVMQLVRSALGGRAWVHNHQMAALHAFQKEHLENSGAWLLHRLWTSNAKFTGGLPRSLARS